MTGQDSLFVSFWGKKEEKKWLGRDSNPEVDHANHYSIGPLLENWEIYLSNIHPTEVGRVFLIHFQKSFFKKSYRDKNGQKTHIL